MCDVERGANRTQVQPGATQLLTVQTGALTPRGLTGLGGGEGGLTLSSPTPRTPRSARRSSLGPRPGSGPGLLTSLLARDIDKQLGKRRGSTAGLGEEEASFSLHSDQYVQLQEELSPPPRSAGSKSSSGPGLGTEPTAWDLRIPATALATLPSPLPAYTHLFDLKPQATHPSSSRSTSFTHAHLPHPGLPSHDAPPLPSSPQHRLSSATGGSSHRDSGGGGGGAAGGGGGGGLRSGRAEQSPSLPATPLPRLASTLQDACAKPLSSTPSTPSTPPHPLLLQPLTLSRTRSRNQSSSGRLASPPKTPPGAGRPPGTPPAAPPAAKPWRFTAKSSVELLAAAVPQAGVVPAGIRRLLAARFPGLPEAHQGGVAPGGRGVEGGGRPRQGLVPQTGSRKHATFRSPGTSPGSSEASGEDSGGGEEEEGGVAGVGDQPGGGGVSVAEALGSGSGSGRNTTLSQSHPDVCTETGEELVPDGIQRQGSQGLTYCASQQGAPTAAQPRPSQPAVKTARPGFSPTSPAGSTQRPDWVRAGPRGSAAGGKTLAAEQPGLAGTGRALQFDGQAKGDASRLGSVSGALQTQSGQAIASSAGPGVGPDDTSPGPTPLWQSELHPSRATIRPRVSHLSFNAQGAPGKAMVLRSGTVANGVGGPGAGHVELVAASPYAGMQLSRTRTFNRAASRKELAVPVVVPVPQLEGAEARTTPDLLAPGDLPDPSLRALFREVQEFGNHASVADALRGLPPKALQALYCRASQRLEHLPSAVVSTVPGSLVMVKLPGPRGVLGYEVSAKGQVFRSRHRLTGRYLSQTPVAKEVLHQVHVLEAQGEEERLGLEADPELVSLWRKLGGRHSRHSRYVAHTQEDSVVVSEHSAVGLASPHPAAGVPGSGIEAQHSAISAASTRVASHVGMRGQLQVKLSGETQEPTRPASPVQRPVSRVAAERSLSTMSRGSPSPLSSSPPPVIVAPPLTFNQIRPVLESTTPKPGSAPHQAGRRGAQYTRPPLPSLATPSLYDKLKDDIINLAPPLLLQAKGPLADWVMRKAATGLLPSSSLADCKGALAKLVEEVRCEPMDLTGDDADAASIFVASDSEVDPEFDFLNAADGPSSGDGSEAGGDTSEEEDAPRAPGRDGHHARFANKAKSHRARSSPLPPPISAVPESDATKGTLNDVLPGDSAEDRAEGTDDAELDAAYLRRTRALASGLVPKGWMRSGTKHWPQAEPGAGPGQLSEPAAARGSQAQRAGGPGWSGSGAVGQLPSAEVLAKLGVVVHGWRQQEAQEEAQAADLRVLKGVLEAEASGGGAVGGRGGAGRGSGALELSAWQPSQEEIHAGEPRTPRLTTAAVERRVQQALATGQGMLDLNLAPRLFKTDLGVVFQTLRDHPSLTTLRATDSLLTPGGLQGLGLLLRHCSWVRKLDLSLCPAVQPPAAAMLAELLHPDLGLALQHLVLDGCPLKDEGLHALLHAVRGGSRLQVLQLRKCLLSDKGLVALQQGILAQDTSLLALDLSENAFGERGVAALAADVCRNTSLQELRLRDCGLTDACAPALASIVAGARFLLLLDLSNNSLSSKAATPLAAALAALEGGAACTPGPFLNTPSSSHSNISGPSSSSSSSRADSSAYSPARQLPSTSAAPDGPSLNMRPAEEAALPGTCALEPSLLHTLLLYDCPMGVTGVTLLFQALQGLLGGPGGSSLRRLGLKGVDLSSPLYGCPWGWDAQRPHSTFTLVLQHPAHRQLAVQLVELWCSSHGAAWLSATLDDQPLYLTLQHGWPQAMPPEGVLKVCVMRRATVPARSPTLGPVLEACTLSQLRSDLVSDAWRSLLVGRVVSITFVTACQAARLLSTFAYRTEKLNAAVLLLSMCTDPAAFLPSMQAAQPLPLPPLASADPNHDPLPLLSPHRHTTPTGLAKAVPKPQTLCEQSSSPVDSDGLLPATSSHPSPSPSPPFSPPSLNHPSSARSKSGLGLEAEVRAGQRVIGERAGEPEGRAMGLASSAQCSCMLLSWRWGEEQLRNHRRLLHGPVLAGSEVEELLGHPWLQVHNLMPGHMVLGPQWQTACSGHFRLDLTQQVHLLLAATLLDLAARPLRSLPIVLQDMSRPSRAVQAADGNGPTEWIWQPRSIGWRSELPGPSGTTRASLRNLRFWGFHWWLPALPTPDMLPRSGVMEFDLVNVHIRSFTHKALGSRASVTMQEARTAAPLASAPPRLKTLVTSVGVILHAANTGFRNNLDAPGAATTNLLSGLMTATGSSKGLGSTGPDANPNPAAKPLTAMWPAAGGRPPPLSRAAANARSVRIACATAYGQLYSRCVELLGLRTEDPRLEGWQDGCSVHTSQIYATLMEELRRQQHLRHHAPPPPSAQPSSPTLTSASQGKKVHKGKQAGAGVSRPGIKAEREAAAVAEHQRLRLAAAVKRAAAVVPIMIAHGAEYLVTVHQLVHLLRLLPQLAMRQTVLMAALPALADPGNTLLAVLDLDCPVPLALLPSEQESFNAASAAATASAAADASHAEQPWLSMLAAATASPDGWSPHAGRPAVGPSPDKVASAGPDGAGDASSPAPPPLDIPSCLLRQVVPCIGWRAVPAYWGCVALLDQELEFNVNRVDELSVAAGLLRFLDRCRGMPDYGTRPALVSAVTDAGPVKLQHEDDLWSYYEQVLSWACARTKLALPPPPPPQPLTPVAHTMPTQSVMALPAGSSSAQNSKQAVGNTPGKTPAKKGAVTQPSVPASPQLGKEGAEAQEEGVDVGGGCATAPVPTLALGLLRVRVAISWEQRLWSAAVLLQAAWRGWRLRRALARALYAEAGWGACTGPHPGLPQQHWWPHLGPRQAPVDPHLLSRCLAAPAVARGRPAGALGARSAPGADAGGGGQGALAGLKSSVGVPLQAGRSGMGMGGGEHAGGQGGLGKAVTGRLTPPNAAHSARLSGGGVLEEDEVFNPPLQASQGVGTHGNSGSGAAGDASADGRPDASTASIGGGLEARDPTAAGSLRPPTKVLSRSQSRGPFMAQLREQCSSTRSFVFSRSSTAVTTLSRAADDVRGPDLTAAATVHSTSATAVDAGGYPAPPSRWKGAWAVWKFARRVAQMQRAGGQLFLTHARSELDANADHLQGPILLV